MERLYIWLGMLVGSYLMVAMCLVMLGQPVRPVGHLLRATTFWHVVSWVAVGVALVVMHR